MTTYTSVKTWLKKFDWHVVDSLTETIPQGAKWIVLEYKKHPILYRVKQQMRQGIDTPRWMDILKFQSRSGLGHLGIIQERPEKFSEPDPMLLIAPLETLRSVQINEYGADGPMTYWPVDWFETYSLTTGQHVPATLRVQSKIDTQPLPPKPIGSCTYWVDGGYCNSTQNVRPYIPGPRCPHHTPAKLAGRSEPDHLIALPPQNPTLFEEAT